LNFYQLSLQKDGKFCIDRLGVH